MTKGDLAEKVAQECKLSKAAADKVALVGFGTFSVSERAAREGRNPKTGEVIQIAAGKVVKFKAGKILADAVK